MVICNDMPKKLSYPILYLSLLSLGFGLIGGLGGLFAGAYIKTALTDKTAKNDLAMEKEKLILRIVEEESATIEAVAKASPSVVSIMVTKDLSEVYRQMQRKWYSSPFDNFFFDIPGFYQFEQDVPSDNKTGQKSMKQKVGGGTGFIISQDGLIVTNRHVVGDPEAEYTVLTKDDQQYQAKVLGTDSIHDIAVVKIEPKKGEKFQVVELGDSDTIKIGQTVLAIGYTLGEFKDTVTKGIVSGINRKISAGNGMGMTEVIEEAIQTDAAINPGNSGGPLLNLKGQVIGINTAMSQAGQLIGFSIPINVVKDIVESVKKYGKFVRAFLGVRYVLVTPEVKEREKLKADYGAYIVPAKDASEKSIVPGSPAERSGLKEGDVILEADGLAINEKNSLAKIISRHAPNEKIKLKILRDGKEMIKEVVLGEFKE